MKKKTNITNIQLTFPIFLWPAFCASLLHVLCWFYHSSWNNFFLVISIMFKQVTKQKKIIKKDKDKTGKRPPTYLKTGH